MSLQSLDHVACGSGRRRVPCQVAYWRVSSLAETRARLERAGATLYRGPLVIGNGEVICQMSDPFGNLLGLIGT